MGPAHPRSVQLADRIPELQQVGDFSGVATRVGGRVDKESFEPILEAQCSFCSCLPEDNGSVYKHRLHSTSGGVRFGEERGHLNKFVAYDDVAEALVQEGVDVDVAGA